MPTPLLTPAEVAEKLKVPEKTIRNWVGLKRIPHVKLGRSLRFDEKRIDNWVAARSIAATIGGKRI